MNVSSARHEGMVLHETDQMCGRVRYLRLGHAFVGKGRVELKSCGHCGARLYLEGLTGTMPLQGQHRMQMTESKVAMPKKVAKDVVNELGAIASLNSAGVVDSPEMKRLKDKLLEEM